MKGTSMKNFFHTNKASWAKKLFVFTMTMLALLPNPVIAKDNEAPQLSDKVIIITPKTAFKILYKRSDLKKSADAFFTPEIEDVLKVEKLLPQFHKNVLKRGYRLTSECFGLFVEDMEPLNEFYRQYIGVEISGQKYLIVNAFYQSYTDPEGFSHVPHLYGYWKFSPVIVYDGGQHYWMVDFNLSTGKLENTQVNFVLGESCADIRKYFKMN
jgi:hypothetical protein